MKNVIYTLLILVLGFLSLAKELHFKSSNNKTTLIELYTSESCSSCPPAEKWLNSLKDDKRIWKDFIPLEFHVDYWNYLNWNDRFSQAEFSTRQRKYNRILKAGVYTPQVIKDAKDWRAWRKKEFNTHQEKAPIVSLSIKNKRISSSISSNSQQTQCHLAYIGGGFKTKVRSGENRGRFLNHEFVVLEHLQQKPNSKGDCSFDFSESLFKDAKNKYLAVWYTDKSKNIVQAVGGEY